MSTFRMGPRRKAATVWEKWKEMEIKVRRLESAGQCCLALQSLSGLLCEYKPNSGEQLAKHAGRLWWRELRRRVKYIGQDKARGRIAQWITQACLERDWRLLKGWVARSGGEGVTALYSRLLLSCRVGLHVGGGGLSGGEGDYITVLQTYAWWCKETPDELWKGEKAERKFPWKFNFKKCKVKVSLIPLIFFLYSRNSL